MSVDEIMGRLRHDYLEDMEALHSKIDQTRAHVLGVIQVMVSNCSDMEGKLSILSYAYWNFKFITIKQLAEMIGAKTHGFNKTLSPLMMKTTCAKCGRIITYPVESRSALTDRYEEVKYNRFGVLEMPKTFHSKLPQICDGCKISEKEDMNIAYEKKKEEWERQLEQLRSLPYRDYLKTDHWMRTKKAALRRAGWSCQLCSKTKTELHVHHRTYERLGEEYASDLIVLCRQCHEKFHDIGE